jgi:hypothetical protein
VQPRLARPEAPWRDRARPLAALCYVARGGELWWQLRAERGQGLRTGQLGYVAAWEDGEAP